MLGPVDQAHPQQVVGLESLASSLVPQVLSQELAAFVEVAVLVVLLRQLQCLVLLLDEALPPFVQARLESGVVVLGQGTLRLFAQIVRTELFNQIPRPYLGV